MTRREHHAHREQRDMVRASLMVDVARETHHDVYSRRAPRLAIDPISLRAVSRSIRELGELLEVAETREAHAWLLLRLRNRMDVLEALVARGGRL